MSRVQMRDSWVASVGRVTGSKCEGWREERMPAERATGLAVVVHALIPALERRGPRLNPSPLEAWPTP